MADLTKFTIESRAQLKNGRDPQKKWLYFLDFPSDSLKALFADELSKAWLEGVNINDLGDEMLVRAQDAIVPMHDTTELKTNFVGMDQVFAGRMNIIHNMTVKFVEFEDQLTYKMFSAWRDRSANSYTGLSLAQGKRAVGNSYAIPKMSLHAYAGNGTKLDLRYEYLNVWVKKISDVQYGYTDGMIEFMVDFVFDLAYPVRNKTTTSGPTTNSGMVALGPGHAG